MNSENTSFTDKPKVERSTNFKHELAKFHAGWLWMYSGVILWSPHSENEPGWDQEIQDDVIEECNKHGGIVHIYVDKNSPQVSLSNMQCNAVFRLENKNCRWKLVNFDLLQWFWQGWGPATEKFGRRKFNNVWCLVAASLLWNVCHNIPQC